MATTDEENQAATPEAALSDKTILKKKNGLIALAGLLVVIAVATILGTTLGSDNSEDSAANLPATVPPTDGKPDEGTPAPNTMVGDMYFNRLASFPICLQLDETCNVDTETVSEIIYASEDGMTLVYTDGTTKTIGFIDITDAANPMPAGTLGVGGEPTSTAVIRNYAVVCVNTSPDFVNPSGVFHVVDMDSKEIVRTMDLGGQPDAVAISPDKNYIAIAIENERDEDFNDGLIPQLPAGFLIVIDSSSENPMEWTMKTVDMVGLDGVLYATDPEPEYVEINTDNIAVVTLQENNGLVLVDLASASVTASFSAGTVDLEMIDIEDNGLITQAGSLSAVPREPDAVAWIGTEHFATADEGDMDGGSRGFTIFDTEGNVVYSSGTEMDDWVTRIGHYPEGRSDNKGNEPETVRYAEFGPQKILFVSSERSSVVFVYEVSDVTSPVLHQILPAGLRPEGIYAIPSRNLVVVASEVDDRAGKIRAHVSIYEMQDSAAMYPTLWSAAMDDGKFIPFSALSGLASSGGMLYSVEDSFYMKSRIFAIDTSGKPYSIVEDMRLTDSNAALAGAVSANASKLLLNVDDMTVNLDLEGIDVIDGGYWVVSEGRGTVDDEASPLETPNLLVRLDDMAVIQEVVRLPFEVDAIQVRYGFEGVAVDGGNVLVAFQRAWTNETSPRLGIYNTGSSTWKFVFYPLDAPESQNGGWVGLSDLSSLGNGRFLVLERDNQGGPDAAIKRLYSIDLGDFAVADGTVIEKVFVRDLMPDLLASGGLAIEKVEGLAVDEDGNVWINTDNDGVDDNSGEQLLLNLGDILT
jgi:hypothetical protein